LWFLTKNKKALSLPSPSGRGAGGEGDIVRNFRDRTGETLFIDARNHGTMVDRTHKELTETDLSEITDTYHKWRSDKHKPDKYKPEAQASESSQPEASASGHSDQYADRPGFCKSATIADIAANDYVLTPGRYVGAAPLEDDGIPFETKMTELTTTLYQQMEDAEKLDKAIRKNLEALGYGE
jgi:type I restriction enzyme M protein